MSNIANIGVLAAFAAGIVSFLSPCVLPLVPGYVSYLAGHAITNRRADSVSLARVHAVALSLCFVFGFSTVFVILGASATALSRFLNPARFVDYMEGNKRAPSWREKSDMSHK